MEERPRYSSLRDYIALLRRRRVLILLVTLAFGLLGLGASLATEPTYEAEAQVVFRDVIQDLPLIGGQGTPAEAPAERAARNAELVGSLALARKVKRQLDTTSSAEDLRGAVTARVGLQTNFVVITTKWGDGRFAAQLANAFAEAAADEAIREQERRIQQGIDAIKARLDEVDETSLAYQFSIQQLGQLQAVQDITDAAEVTQRAEAPELPTSPRPKRNTAIGLMLGFAFGLIAAFVRDALDRRLRTAREVHDELPGVPILGRVAGTALGSGGLGSTGIYLSLQDQESFRMLRTNLAFWRLEPPPRTVLVTSGLAQEGKSTAAAALATASAVAGQRTLLVDCDLRRPVLATRLGIRPVPGLADYLAGTASPADVLQTLPVTPSGTIDPAATSSPEPAGTLVCVSAGTSTRAPAELLASARCRDFLAKVTKAYDLVVIDTSPLLATVDPLELVPFVDAVLVCVRLGKSNREELRAVHDALSRMPEKPLGLVLTGSIGAGDDYGYYGYEN
jgi:capsular exopolysaccharide synthesis family protein